MMQDSTYLIHDAAAALEALDITPEQVQALFDEWWPKRIGDVAVKEMSVVYTVEIVDRVGIAGAPVSRKGELCFPKDKLSKAQFGNLASDYVMWGAGRAAAIALVPIPLADVGPLIANEAYMIYRIGQVYGYTVDKSVVTMLAGVAGGSLVGKLFASFLPFLKVPIAAGVTYGVGKAAQAFFASGMTLSTDELKKIFSSAKDEAKDINWNEHKVTEAPTDLNSDMMASITPDASELPKE